MASPVTVSSAAVFGAASVPGAPRAATKVPARLRLPVTTPAVDCSVPVAPIARALPAPVTAVPFRFRRLLPAKARPAEPVTSRVAPVATLTVAPVKAAPVAVLRVPATATVPPRAASRVKAWPAAMVAVPA